jgi:ADP-heptose:LPS heptosyltransferase
MAQKILAIKLRSLGDTVLMTAPLLEMRRAYPSAAIHALVRSEWAPLLENHPAVNQVWAYDRRQAPASRARTLARWALRLRRERYDTVVNFHASPSSSLLALATGARTRSIHFHGHAQRNHHSTLEVPGKGSLKPIIERDMDAVRALGVKIPEGRLPRLEPTDRERAEARAMLDSLGLRAPVLGIGVGASRPTKAWPVERYAEVAARWCREQGGSVLAVGSAAEEGTLQALLRAAGEPAVRAHSGLAPRQLAAAIAELAVFLGNDSGPRHVAVAVGVPTVTLFGPEDPFEWHPYPKARHPVFFVESLACRKDAAPGMPPWCGLEECVEERHRCLREIPVEPVLAQCRKALEARSA